METEIEKKIKEIAPKTRAFVFEEIGLE